MSVMNVFCSDADIARIDYVKRARHGMPWSCEDYDKLQISVEDGFTLEAICNYLQRPAAGVIAKMRDKYITYDILGSVYHWKNLNQSTQPETKLENDMTQPLNTITFLFGTDIKECTTDKLIKAIQTCQNEITSFNNIPRNKWTEKRTVELNAAIDAAVAELDTRA